MNKCRASDIAEFLGAELIGPDLEIAGVSSIRNPQPHTVSYSKLPMEFDLIPKDVLILIGEDAVTSKKWEFTVILVRSPVEAYADVVEQYFMRKTIGISPRAILAADVQLGEGVYVGDNAIIEEGVVIGANTHIDHGAIIGWGTHIGSDCRIGANVVIGRDGLGSFIDRNGHWRNIRHMGRVVIEDCVDIGPLSTVGRGTMDQTLVGQGTNIGPQVNVGHNVIIGKDCLIAGRAHISGSVVLGNNCTLWANCVVKDGIRIGDNAVVGMGALVQHDVLELTTVAMLQAIPLRKLARFMHLTKWGR